MHPVPPSIKSINDQSINATFYYFCINIQELLNCNKRELYLQKLSPWKSQSSLFRPF